MGDLGGLLAARAPGLPAVRVGPHAFAAHEGSVLQEDESDAPGKVRLTHVLLTPLECAIVHVVCVMIHGCIEDFTFYLLTSRCEYVTKL